MQQQLTTMQARLAQDQSPGHQGRTRAQEGDAFLAEYTTDRRTTFSTIFAELERIAQEAGIQPRPRLTSWIKSRAATRSTR
jgi:hypothetical protein